MYQDVLPSCFENLTPIVMLLYILICYLCLININTVLLPFYGNIQNNRKITNDVYWVYYTAEI